VIYCDMLFSRLVVWHTFDLLQHALLLDGSLVVKMCHYVKAAREATILCRDKFCKLKKAGLLRKTIRKFKIFTEFCIQKN